MPLVSSTRSCALVISKSPDVTISMLHLANYDKNLVDGKIYCLFLFLLRFLVFSFKNLSYHQICVTLTYLHKSKDLHGSEKKIRRNRAWKFFLRTNSILIFFMGNSTKNRQTTEIILSLQNNDMTDCKEYKNWRREFCSVFFIGFIFRCYRRNWHERGKRFPNIHFRCFVFLRVFKKKIVARNSWNFFEL